MSDLRLPWTAHRSWILDCDGATVAGINYASTERDDCAIASAIVAAMNATLPPNPAHVASKVQGSAADDAALMGVCRSCDGTGYTEEPDTDEFGGMCRSLSYVPCRSCTKPMSPTPQNDPEPDVCSSCAEAGEPSSETCKFGVQTIGAGTEWFSTLDAAWSKMGDNRRIVKR